MKKAIALVLTCCLMGSGCVSYLAMESTRTEMRRTAFRASEMAGGGVGVGLDVTQLEALQEKPGRQVIAAIMDGLIIGGTLWAAREYVHGAQQQSTGDTHVEIRVEGDGNTIWYRSSPVREGE